MAVIDLVAVVLLTVIGVMVVQNRRSATDQSSPRPLDPEAQRLAQEVRDLRARIQVLERVITDNHGSTDLANEIDRLRDR